MLLCFGIVSMKLYKNLKVCPVCSTQLPSGVLCHFAHLIVLGFHLLLLQILLETKSSHDTNNTVQYRVRNIFSCILLNIHHI